jgi:hypothetical protein
LVALPKTRALDVLRKSPKLQENILDYIQGLPVQQQSRREFVGLKEWVREAQSS